MSTGRAAFLHEAARELKVTVVSGNRIRPAEGAASVTYYSIPLSDDPVAGKAICWHRLQRWLAAGQRNVIISFAEQLADRVLALAVGQRRDFGAMLTLIRAHALLHRASRDLTEAGAIIASMEDYAVVRKLVDDLFLGGN